MIAVDRAIVRWLNSASLDQPVRAVAILAARYLAAVPPLLLIGVFLWALSRRDTRGMTRAGLAAIGAGLALGANQIVGQLVARVRPYSALASVHAIGSRSGDSSFYSDHTTVAVGTAIGVFLVARRLGIAALILATMVGIGRIALGAHYPSDVLTAAAAAGIGVAAMLALTSPVQGLLDRIFPARGPAGATPGTLPAPVGPARS